MQSSEPSALRWLKVSEGGYTNHPADPGGPTNFGITLTDTRLYIKPGATAADVKALTWAQASAVYDAKYWDALNCDKLPAGLDYTIFDYGVNSGIARAGKVLRRVMDVEDDTWKVDESVFVQLARLDPIKVMQAVNDERLHFLKSLKTWPVFGAGWEKRVNSVRANSLALAKQAPILPPIQAPPVAQGKGVVPPPAAVKKVIVAGSMAGGAGASGAGHEWLWSNPQTGIILAIGMVVAVGGVVYWIERAHQNRQQAPAPGWVRPELHTLAATT